MRPVIWIHRAQVFCYMGLCCPIISCSNLWSKLGSSRIKMTLRSLRILRLAVGRGRYLGAFSQCQVLAGSLSAEHPAASETCPSQLSPLPQSQREPWRFRPPPTARATKRLAPPTPRACLSTRIPFPSLQQAGLQALYYQHCHLNTAEREGQGG